MPDKPVKPIAREQKLELIERLLGLKHKLKVHDSMRLPDTHEDMAAMMLAKWDFEDEIRAIDEMLAEIRLATVKEMRGQLAKQLGHGPLKVATKKKS